MKKLKILENLMQVADVNQPQLAAITGINQQQISRYLNGINSITWERLNFIAKKLNLKINYSLKKL